MDTKELRNQILEEAKRTGVTLTEDELNEKLLEASRMDTEKLDRLNGGGGVANCTRNHFCWSDYMCVIWSKGRD